MPSSKNNTTTKQNRLIRAWQVNGREVRSFPDPGPVVLNPWNSVTLEFYTSFDGSGTPLALTNQSLVQRLGVQVGAGTSEDFPATFMIQKIKAWNLGGGALDMFVADRINGKTGDPSQVQARPLTVIRDWAGRDQWSSVGYEFGKTHSRITTSSKDDTTIVAIFKGGSSGHELLVRTDVLWKLVDNSDPLTRAFGVVKDLKDD